MWVDLRVGQRLDDHVRLHAVGGLGGLQQLMRVAHREQAHHRAAHRAELDGVIGADLGGGDRVRRDGGAHRPVDAAAARGDVHRGEHEASARKMALRVATTAGVEPGTYSSSAPLSVASARCSPW